MERNVFLKLLPFFVRSAPDVGDYQFWDSFLSY